ncbi:MAG: PEP-CTERM sorting domain-containing protein [Opitutales bacterium]|nr:PEP-CTERM sorting domain-containing protein [Opitutales bacterium]
MKKLLLLSLLGLWLGSSFANGQTVLAFWDFNGESPTSAVLGDGLEYDASQGSGLLETFSSATTGTNFRIDSDGTSLNSLDGVGSDDAMRFQRGPRWNNGGFEISVDMTNFNSAELSYATYNTGNTTGDYQFSYRVGTEGSFTNIGSPTTIPLSNYALVSTSIPSAVDNQEDVFFRVTFSNLDGSSGNAGHRVMVDNVQVTAIPEPSTYAAIFGLFALGMIVWHRRKRS